MPKSRRRTSPPLQRGEKRILGASQDLEHLSSDAKGVQLRYGGLRGGCRFIVISAISLDGRITAGKKEGSEWTSREDKKFFQGELDRADAIIMGRKTFEAIKRPLKPRNRIVFSSSASLQRERMRGGGNIPLNKGGARPCPAVASCGGGVREGGGCLIPFNGSPKKLLALLHKNNWTNVAIVGGTQIYDWFLKHDLVDEIYFTLEPIIFGSGKPLASKELRHLQRFKLVSIKKLNSQGTLTSHYKLEN